MMPPLSLFQFSSMNQTILRPLSFSHWSRRSCWRVRAPPSYTNANSCTAYSKNTPWVCVIAVSIRARGRAEHWGRRWWWWHWEWWWRRKASKQTQTVSPFSHSPLMLVLSPDISANSIFLLIYLNPQSYFNISVCAFCRLCDNSVFFSYFTWK